MFRRGLKVTYQDTVQHTNHLGFEVLVDGYDWPKEENSTKKHSVKGETKTVKELIRSKLLKMEMNIKGSFDTCLDHAEREMDDDYGLICIGAASALLDDCENFDLVRLAHVLSRVNDDDAVVHRVMDSIPEEVVVMMVGLSSKRGRGEINIDELAVMLASRINTEPLRDTNDLITGHKKYRAGKITNIV